MATSVHMYVQKKIKSLKTKYNGMNTNKTNEHHQISDHLIWATFKGHFNSLAKKHSTFDQKNWSIWGTFTCGVYAALISYKSVISCAISDC